MDRNALKDHQFISGEVSICKVNEKEIKSSSSLIHITEIRLDGIKFISRLNFPITDKLILQFTLYGFEREFTLKGIILGALSLQHGKKLYEVRFLEHEDKQIFDRMITALPHLIHIHLAEEDQYLH